MVVRILKLNALVVVALMVAVFGGPVGTAAGQTPLPEASGPLPVTAASHPFNSTLFNRTARDLSAEGYVEEEFLVKSTANVYDWSAEDSLSTLAAGPYVTRIVVRRPARRRAFSGNVVVEMLNPTSLHDLDIVWAASQDHFIRKGDIWVGLTVKPSSIAALKKFDANRYGTLSMATPGTPRCTSPTWSGATAETENGLVWDMVSQLGALLKSDAGSNPVRRFDVRSAYLTGYSQTANYLTTYINAIAPRATLENGEPVFEGYLPIASAVSRVPINQCAAPPEPGSARWVIQPPGDAPVIAIQTLSDFYALNGFFGRRADSTGEGGNYRLYEVAGAGHVWATQVAHAVGSEDLVRSGFPATWWDPYCERDVTTFPLEYAMNAAFMNMYRWVDRGIPAPIAPRIEVTDPTSPTATAVRDASGNVVGGLRLPAIEAPRAAYFGTTSGTGTCQILWGHEEALSGEQLAALYPTDRDYLAQVRRSARALARARWLTRADARAIIGAARALPGLGSQSFEAVPVG